MASREVYRKLLRTIGRKLELTQGEQALLVRMIDELALLDELQSVDTDRLLPAGGLTEEALVKNSEDDYDVGWSAV